MKICAAVGRRNGDMNMNSREMVIECYKRLFNALVEKDAEQLDMLLSEGFAHVHMTGMRLYKEQYISGIVNGIQNYRSVDHDNIEVELINNCARVHGKTRAMVAAYGGAVHEWKLEQMIKMTLKGGQWHIDEIDVMPYE